MAGKPEKKMTITQLLKAAMKRELEQAPAQHSQRQEGDPPPGADLIGLFNRLDLNQAELDRLDSEFNVKLMIMALRRTLLTLMQWQRYLEGSLPCFARKAVVGFLRSHEGSIFLAALKMVELWKTQPASPEELQEFRDANAPLHVQVAAHFVLDDPAEKFFWKEVPTKHRTVDE